MKFEAYKDGKILDNLSLSGAYMFGADAIPIRSPHELTFNQGIIDCRRKNHDSAGLSLLWEVDGFGRIILPTTRLPERTNAYNLNVELARAKLMEITMKREDWAFLEENSSFVELAHEAQDMFIEALENITNGPLASTLADESLKKAMVFSELLTARNADLFMRARRKAKGFARHSLGCVVDPKKITDKNYLKRFGEIFGFLTIPVNWGQIEQEKGEFDFTEIDRCFEVLMNRKAAICAGPLLCFEQAYLPKWLKQNAGYAKVREAAYEFITKFVNRYARHVHAWRVIRGMNAWNHFEFSFEQMLEMTRAATMAARAANNRSLKIVEITQPWGEYYTEKSSTIPPMVYIDMIMQSGINPDAIGVDLIMGKNARGMHIRDMMQISALLDRFAALAKPVHLTSVEAPGIQGNGQFSPDTAGIWHEQWCEQLQSKWIEQIYKIALGKPFINSITYNCFADSQGSTLLSSGLVKENLEPKPSFKTITKLQKYILT